MDYSRKRHIATVVLVIAACCAFIGFGRMYGEAMSGHVSLSTQVLFFGGLIAALAAAMSRQYWNSRFKHTAMSQKIAMDALNEVGRQASEEKRKIGQPKL